VLRWDVFHLDGRRLQRGRKTVALRPGESVRQHTVELAKLMARYNRDSIYLRIALETGGERVSEETVFLTPPRFLHLPQARTSVTVRLDSPRRATLTFASTAFQHRFAFDLRGISFQGGDNYFELYPNEKKVVTVAFERPQTAARIRRALTHRSLVDTY
jgi:beta-mannosidase